jgi:hypothetical protein
MLLALVLLVATLTLALPVADDDDLSNNPSNILSKTYILAKKLKRN